MVHHCMSKRKRYYSYRAIFPVKGLFSPYPGYNSCLVGVAGKQRLQVGSVIVGWGSGHLYIRLTSTRDVVVAVAFVAVGANASVGVAAIVAIGKGWWH